MSNTTTGRLHRKTRAFGSLSNLAARHQDNFKDTIEDQNDIRNPNLSNGVFSMLRNLEELRLKGNRIDHLEVGVFAPLTSLTVLDLSGNQLNAVDFKVFLSLHTHSTHIWLAGNPWICDCDLQRVFPFRVTPSEMVEFPDLLQIAENCPPPCLIITVTVLITVVTAIIMAETKRKKSNKGKHWTEVSEMSCDSQN
ncbi:hypothetical protein NFI96_032696 [Prochilodus magdalenae]|nr:hypothetical protein NFI96_032696 [Prochilodus magdalenae]